MADKVKNLRNELRQLKVNNEFIQEINCSYEQNKNYQKLKKENGQLPDDVFEYMAESGESTDSFYMVYESDLTDDEKKEYVMLKQLESFKNISTIKNCVVFFTTIIIISLVISLINFFVKL